jgi:hypothetical protein
VTTKISVKLINTNNYHACKDFMAYFTLYVSLSKLPRIDYQHKNDLLVIKHATFYALMKGPNWLGGK